MNKTGQLSSAGAYHGYVLHRSLRNTAASVINYNKPAQFQLIIVSADFVYVHWSYRYLWCFLKALAQVLSY